MIEEYDRTIITTAKRSRLRLFLFTEKPEATQSMGKILESKGKSDDWFLDTLNNAGVISRSFSDSDANVNRLFSLDALRSDSDETGKNLDSSVKDDDGSVKSDKQDDGSVKKDYGSVKSVKQQQIEQPQPQQQQGGQDVHNVADSSSFGSTSSSPTLANLPLIRVHVEEAGGVRGMQDQKLGNEEQLARFNVGSKQQLTEDGFAAISSPPLMPMTISIPAAPVNATTVSSEFNDQGVSAGYRKPPTPHSQPQNLPPPQGHLVKSNSGGHELPSPNSVSSDNSMNNNPVFRQKPSLYQEPMSQMPSENGMINPSEQHTLLSQSQNQNQNQDPGYNLPPQQSHPQQQQFIHAASPQYIHHHSSNGHPLPTYIQLYPSPSQQHHQPYPFYYLTSHVPHTPYNMHVQQSGSVSEAPGSLPSNHPQAPPNNTMMAPPSTNHLRSVASGPGGKPKSGVYATSSGMSGAQMVHQIPASQQQFMGYSQIHHPPQSGYEYADNAHKQMYYTLPIRPAQYQTLTGSPPAMVLPDGSTSAKLPAENMSQ